MAKVSRRKSTTKKTGTKAGRTSKTTKASAKKNGDATTFEVGAKVPLTETQLEEISKMDTQQKTLTFALGTLNNEYELRKSDLIGTMMNIKKGREQKIRDFGSDLLKESVGPESKEKWTFFTEDNAYVRQE